MVNYIPIITTIFALFFFLQLLSHYKSGSKPTYLFWWTIGVLTYGIGTLTESINVLAGWSQANLKLWYITGALLGGFPLAQGTVYLLLRKRVANILTVILFSIIIVASVLVLLSPINIPANFDHRLSGKVFQWQYVRLFSPFINSYSFVFLFGGAIYSAYRYSKLGKSHPRFLGNVFISIGALLPGIGGSFTRFGHVEILFITELIGLIFIFFGYYIIRQDKMISVHLNQRTAAYIKNKE
jgi:hypothetical protein